MFVLALAAVLPASAHAVIDVTQGGWDIPGAFDPSNALIVNGHNGSDDVIVATYVPTGPSGPEIHVTSPAGVQDLDGPGAGACETDGSAVVCELGSLDNTIVLVGNGGSDTLTLAGPAHPAYNVYVYGGPGNDTLVGGPGVENLYGDDATGLLDCFDPIDNPSGAEACNDTFRDGMGADRVIGEGGSDTVVQTALGGVDSIQDTDDINLGDGSADTVSYAERVAADAVTIQLPAPGLSGSDGEGDLIQNGAENVIGTPGNDTFKAGSSSFAMQLSGGDGDDVFYATDVSERFSGGAGLDTVTWADAEERFNYDGIVATVDGIANDGDPDLGETDDLLPDVEHVVGSTGNDTMSGAPVAECRVAGGAGADTISAPATGCILEGGDGADTLVGGAGADVLRPGGSGTVAADSITFGAGDDVVDYATRSFAGGTAVSGVDASAASGAVTWCSQLGVGVTSARKRVSGVVHLDTYVDAPERIVGTTSSDTLCGGDGSTRLEPGDGNDSVTGGPGSDTVLGGNGDDLVNGQGGNDVIDGGDGADTLNGGAGSDTVDGGAGDDAHVRGGGGSDIIRGGAGNDVLDELESSTIAQGQAASEADAADVLDGGAGTDIIDGNVGNDVIACTSDVFGDLLSDTGGGVEVIDCSGWGGPVTIAAGTGIDRLVGSAFADTLSGADLIEGGFGNDTLVARASGSTLDGGDETDTLVGGAGPDTLRGGQGGDVLRGGDGNDTLLGESGDDSLFGDGGDDTLSGGGSADAISGGAGTDSTTYADRNVPATIKLDGIANDGTAGEGDNIADDVELITGTTSDDVMVGGANLVTFTGGVGNDRLTGGSGTDTLDGGGGSDTLAGEAGADRLLGGAGTDKLDGGLGADVLAGGAGADTVTYATRKAAVIVTLGSKANDGQKGERDDVQVDVETVVGGAGNDALTGSKGSQTLRGGRGNDTLVGGVGLDRMYGDAGNDIMRSRDKVAREVVDGGAGRDRAQVDTRDKVVRVETRLR